MIVIHIGMPKAGSTTIQAFLRHNEEALRGSSVDYPMVGREDVEGALKHGAIAKDVAESKGSVRKKRDSISQLVAHLAEGKFQNTIISSEGFYRAEKNQIADFRRALSSTDSNIRIIMIIRDLIGSLPSAYAERVKVGKRDDDFDSFYAQRAGSRSASYFQIAERWANVFGWDAMAVRVLAPAGLIDGDLITDFMVTCGLNKDAFDLAAFPRPPRGNEAPGWRTTEALRAFFGCRTGLVNEHPLMTKPMPKRRSDRRAFAATAQAVSHDLEWDKDKGQYITCDQAQSCWQTFSISIELLNERLSEELPMPPSPEEQGFVGRRFLPDVSHIPPAELRAFYNEMAARLGS